VRDLETSRIGAPYIYDISNLRVKRYKKMQNIASINYNVVINWLLTLSNSFLIFKTPKFI